MGLEKDHGRLLTALAEDANGATDAMSFRQALLNRLMRYIGADSASFIPVPRPAVPDEVAVMALANIEPKYGARWLENRSRYWRLMPEVVATLARAGIVIDGEVYGRRERERRAPYTETLIPLGISSILCTPVRFQCQATALLCLNRHGRGPAFTRRQADKVLSIIGMVGLVDAAMLSLCEARGSQAGLGVLSSREREVAALIGDGLQNKEIAVLLGTAAETVRKQARSIYSKLGVSGRVQLVARFGGGLVPTKL